MGALVPLKGLAKQINEAHAAAEAALRTGLEHAKVVGDLLLRAKAEAGHGGWLAWLKANCAFSVRVAQGYMRVAGRWDELSAKTKHVSHLPLREALATLSKGHGDGAESKDAAEAKERDAALRELGRSDAAGVIKSLRDSANFSLLPTAVETGYAADGRFLTRLTPEEHEAIKVVAGTAPGRSLTPEKIRAVIKARPGTPAEVSLRIRGGLTMVRCEGGRFTAFPTDRINLIRRRYPGAQLTLDKAPGNTLRAWDGDEAVAVLMPDGGSPGIGTLQELRASLQVQLERLRELGAAALAEPSANGKGEALQVSGTLSVLAAVRAAVVAVEEANIEIEAGGIAPPAAAPE
jgi:hypothetical protein